MNKAEIEKPWPDQNLILQQIEKIEKNGDTK